MPQHIHIDDLIDRTRPSDLIKGGPLTFPAASTLSMAVAALAEIKLNKFYNTFAPAHSPLGTHTHTCAAECNQFFTNDDDTDAKDGKSGE